ncbi:hypothetical protein RU639_013616 [Aspergillus parasiticus]
MNNNRHTRINFFSPTLESNGTLNEQTSVGLATFRPKKNSKEKSLKYNGECGVSIREEPPWRIYDEDLSVMLDMWLSMVVRRDDGKIFAIRKFPEENADRIQRRYKSLNHHHLVTAFQIFRTDDPRDHLFVVSEFLPLHLDHMILNALCYLQEQGLSHESLQCSSVLFTFEGVLKIADFRDAKIRHGSENEFLDVKAAGYIMMQVMHHKRPTDGRMCVLDNSRGVDTVDFLAQIDAGSSAAELTRHSFLSFPNGSPKWTPDLLCNLVFKTIYSAQVDYVRVNDQ